VHEIDLKKNKLPILPDNTQVVFPVLHGSFGEDGGIQALLEDGKIPFVGSSSSASRTIMNKILTKRILEEHAVLTPQYRAIETSDAPFPEELKLPFIVKPANEGSTFGLSIVNYKNEWKNALENAFEKDTLVLAEEYIKGTEITVGIINGEALPVIEIIPPGKLFDLDAKYFYKNGKTQYLCPPENVDKEHCKKAQKIAEKCFRILDAKDILRVDIIIKNLSFYVLEANSIPGFTASSLLPKAAAKTGISFVELCDQLVRNVFFVNIRS
ncbi:MAG: D-alanine--D-alanine ligase, partial [Verrucomicrobiota bacterium]|nr:D-alanine--D-alanine ligase [Verrucomicrobiota bacterium]